MGLCRAASLPPTASSRDVFWPPHCSPSSSVSCSVRQKKTARRHLHLFPNRWQSLQPPVSPHTHENHSLVQNQQFLWKTVKESMVKPLAPPLHEAPGIQGRRRYHPPVRCRDLGSLSEADQATGVVSPTLPVLHPWHQMARPCVEQRSLQKSQPAQHRVHLASGATVLG